jgi:CMP-N-acetylneuraminic acid synthetase
MLVTIIITNYNYSKYLHRCIRSCLKQSLDDDKIEIILVDDNSTDNSIDIAQDYIKLPNFRLIALKKNKGVAYCSNIGLKKAKGKYVIRVDSDDYVTNEFANFLSYYLIENSNILGVSCDYYLVDDEEKKIKHINAEKFPVSCGIMYDKKKLLKLGGYNPKFLHREEEELRVRLGQSYKLHNLSLPLYRYRMHKSNKTKSKNYKDEFKKKIVELKNKQKTQLVSNHKLTKNIIAIIPARIGSQRLKNKNIYPFKGKPMIYWIINAAKNACLVKDVYVTSESDKILNLSKKFGAKTIKRPANLSGNDVYKIEAIKHAVKKIFKLTDKKPTLVISLQANSPDTKSEDIDNSIIKLIRNKKNEIISVDNNHNQNAAIRVMKYKTVFQNSLSTYLGCLFTDSSDIHTLKDLKKLEKKT